MTSISTLNSPRWIGLSANMVLFYAAVPLVIGITFSGLTYPQLNSVQWPLLLVQTYSVVMVFLGWLIRDWACALFARFWRGSGLPLVAALILGAFIANIIIFPFNIALQSIFETFFVPPDLHVAQIRWTALTNMETAYLSDALINHILPALFLWTTINLAFYHLLGLPRYGYPDSQLFTAINRHAQEQSPAADGVVVTPPRSSPAFMALLPENRRREDVIAIKAEQHYVRIYTRAGEDLVHERFRSVVSEFEYFGGQQVHRSYAVNPEFVQEVTSETGHLEVVLVSGLRVPVSRSYAAIAKRMLNAVNSPAVNAT